MRKIVVPIAGLGTRLLPTTRALPKEMLPLGKFPAIQLVVEEMVAAKLQKFLFITSSRKSIIENQFDNSLDIGNHAKQNGQLQNSVNLDYNKRGIEFLYARQQILPGASKPGGTGAAIAAAESFVDDEHFVVAYGDTVIHSTLRPNFIQRMIETHVKYNATCTVGVRFIPSTLVSLYGIVQAVRGEDIKADGFLLKDIVEKPAPELAPSYMAVSARYIFGPEIFNEIRKLHPSSAGEIGITDAIRGLIRSGHAVRAVRMKQDETRYDIGNHESYFKAFIDFARTDPDCGEAIQKYLESCVSEYTAETLEENLV